MANPPHSSSTSRKTPALLVRHRGATGCFVSSTARPSRLGRFVRESPQQSLVDRGHDIAWGGKGHEMTCPVSAHGVMIWTWRASTAHDERATGVRSIRRYGRADMARFLLLRRTTMRAEV
jgi:hypothetical protein